MRGGQATRGSRNLLADHAATTRATSVQMKPRVSISSTSRLRPRVPIADHRCIAWALRGSARITGRHANRATRPTKDALRSVAYRNDAGITQLVEPRRVAFGRRIA